MRITTSFITLALAALVTAGCQCKSCNTKVAEIADDGSTIAAYDESNGKATNNEMTITEMHIKDIDGNDHSLREEIAKNKITIVDFWASWCGPCRQEMPSLVNLYGSYKDKGLGIVGISLDTEKEAWKEAISNLGITWCQLSDLGGWDSEAAMVFNVRGIPYTIVTDSKGTILATGLRGSELEQFIEEKLK